MRGRPLKPIAPKRRAYFRRRYRAQMAGTWQPRVPKPKKQVAERKPPKPVGLPIVWMRERQFVLTANAVPMRRGSVSWLELSSGRSNT